MSAAPSAQVTCAKSLHELQELQAFCTQREGDLGVLTQEVLRLRQATGAG